jgi:hypothetical protein
MPKRSISSEVKRCVSFRKKSATEKNWHRASGSLQLKKTSRSTRVKGREMVVLAKGDEKPVSKENLLLNTVASIKIASKNIVNESGEASLLLSRDTVRIAPQCR